MRTRLPPGRHGLSRDQVAGAQRRRMLEAMIEASAELGYAKVTVADVLKRAGVSRETFYEQFANKEDCFLAAYLEAVAALERKLQAAVAGPPEAATDPLDRVSRLIDGYLEALSDPALAWTFLIEINAVGPRVVKQRAEAQAQAIGELAAIIGAEGDRQRLACEMLFTAMVGMATQRVGAGRADELRELGPPLKELARASLMAVGLGSRRATAGPA
ncbi:MAG TPA: TetR/AcrR family transcriptional regulator [Solirubrobacterales bacterium]|nr:TetR/AcrR family transcriptional regulator [Solirubrobacterales bacterium]